MKLYWEDEIKGTEYKYYRLKRQTPTLRPFLGIHSHDYAEILYIERGGFNHILNKRIQNVKKGNILFIPPECAMHKITDYDNSISILQILFPQSSYNFIYNRYRLPNWSELWDADGSDPFHMSHTEQQWFETNFNKMLISENSLFEIERFLLNFFALIGDSQKRNKTNTHIYWLDKAFKEIQEPENFKIGVQAFISICGRSHEHAERELKKRTNQTITEVVNAARMAWASYMLIFSDVEIMDIAYGCGFNSLSYFYKLFHTYFNTSPIKYRKSLKNHSDIKTDGEFQNYMAKLLLR